MTCVRLFPPLSRFHETFQRAHMLLAPSLSAMPSPTAVQTIITMSVKPNVIAATKSSATRTASNIGAYEFTAFIFLYVSRK